MTRARFYTSIHAPGEKNCILSLLLVMRSCLCIPNQLQYGVVLNDASYKARPAEVECGYPKLFDSSNTQVGHLYYLFDGDKTNITATNIGSTCLSPITVELVAISQGRCAWEVYQPNNCYDDTRDDYEEDAQKEFNYYKVLSIERMNGVPYRTAVGTVRKDEWEKQALEWIDLALG